MLSSLNEIISGGQTGVDQAGLYAGKALGLKTSGTAPWNWMTDEGRAKDLLESFGLVDGPYDARIYPKRTKLNVNNSDGTLLMGRLTSSGTKLTIKYCRSKELNKPFITNPTLDDLLEWLIEHNIKVLNVAGNRERKNPGIFNTTLELILGLKNCINYIGS